MTNATLIMEERNTMQIHPSRKKLLILTGISLVLGGCSISDWYNGYYVDRSSMKHYLEERSAYYDAESQEIKQLRNMNDVFCRNLASKPENLISRAGYPNGLYNSPMYEICMKENGTPTFDAYSSIQAEKRRAERRARGEIVPENQ